MQRTVRRDAINPEHRLIVCLRYLATGDSFRTLAYNFLLGETTVGRICRETCQAVVDVLAPEVLAFPATDAEWKAVADRFWEKWNMPNCVGM